MEIEAGVTAVVAAIDRHTAAVMRVAEAVEQLLNEENGIGSVIVYAMTDGGESLHEKLDQIKEVIALAGGLERL